MMHRMLSCEELHNGEVPKVFTVVPVCGLTHFVLRLVPYPQKGTTMETKDTWRSWFRRPGRSVEQLRQASRA